MRKLQFTFLMFMSLWGANSLFAQTTLSVGDISIIGYRGDADDALAFVTWVDLAPNTEIRFTDNGWLSTGAFRVGEDSVVWVNNTGNTLTKGTVITGVFSASTGVSPVWNLGTSTAGKLSGISATGDQIFAYQGHQKAATLIFGLYTDGAWAANATSANNSALPTVLNVYGGNFAVAPEVDNAQYNGLRTGLTQSLYKEAIFNMSNWTTDDAGTVITTLNTTPFTIVADPEADIKLIQIVSPVSGCGLTNSENVTVKFTNNGISAIDSIPLVYTFDGITLHKDTLFTSLMANHGDTSTYTFINKADLSIPNIYNLVVYANLASDLFKINDTLKSTINSVPLIATYPYLQDFESANHYWSSGAITGVDIWQKGTPASTNIIGAASGTQAFATNLTGNYNASSNIWLMTPCFDLSTLINPMLSVKINMFIEPNYDAMVLEYSTDGSTWVKLVGDANFYNNTSAQAPVAPPKWSAELGTWDLYKTSISALAGQASVKFRFRFQSDNTTQGDGVAIDDFNIYDKPSYDIKVVQWVAPISGCGLTNNESIIAKVTNIGVVDIDSIPMGYSINAGVTIVKDTIFSTLHANGADTLTFTFATKADFSINGTYDCGIASGLASDGDKTNDTIFNQVSSLPLIATYPYLQNFESANHYWSSGAIAGTDIWQKGTPSSTNIIGAASGTQAFATNLAGDYNASSNIWLMTPCFDLSTLANPMLSVKINMFVEAAWDAMVLEYTLDGSTWLKLTGDANFYNNTSANGTVTPPKWSGELGTWDLYKTSISALAGQADVKFRFRFESDNSTQADGVAIDDFSIYGLEPNDVGATEIMAINNTSCGDDNDNVFVVVKNFGSSAQDTVPVQVNITTPSGLVTLVDTLFANLLPNTSDTLLVGTFNSTANGIYSFVAYTKLSSDILNPDNDTAKLQKTVLVIVPLALPYTENFNGTSNTWTGNMGWITGHTNATKVLSENLYDTNPSAYAMSPKLGTITSNTYLKFDYSIVNYTTLDTTDITSADSIAVYFVTCDSTYHVYTINSLNHIPSDTLATKMIPVGNLIGQDGYIYFDLKWAAGDYWVDIDNVVLAEPKTIDLGNDTIVCGELSVTLDAGTGFDSYAWFNGATTSTVTIDSVGHGLTTVTVYVDAIDPIFKIAITDTVLVTFDNCTGIEENSMIANVYPNPTNSSLNIAIPSSIGTVNIELFNLQGETLIQTTEYNKSLVNVNLSNLANGMYILKVTGSQGVYTQRVTLQK